MIGARITNLRRGQDPEDMKKKSNAGIPALANHHSNGQRPEFRQTANQPFEPVTIEQAAGRLNVSRE
jgi:hypothetical protein